MTENRAFKQAVRARMDETGEKYTQARRVLLAQRAERKRIADELEAANWIVPRHMTKRRDED